MDSSDLVGEPALKRARLRESQTESAIVGCSPMLSNYVVPPCFFPIFFPIPYLRRSQERKNRMISSRNGLQTTGYHRFWMWLGWVNHALACHKFKARNPFWCRHDATERSPAGIPFPVTQLRSAACQCYDVARSKLVAVCCCAVTSVLLGHVGMNACLCSSQKPKNFAASQDITGLWAASWSEVNVNFIAEPQSVDLRHDVF
jgi:hypothetical protein